MGGYSCFELKPNHPLLLDMRRTKLALERDGDRLGDVILTDGSGVYSCILLGRQGRDSQGLR